MTSTISLKAIGREDENNMTVVHTFEERKREKQLKNERTLLGELSIDALKKSVIVHFSVARIGSYILLDEGAEEACIDVAIEAYLVGGEVSKFSINGEEMEEIKLRCQNELDHFIDTLYHFWLYCDYGRGTLTDDEIFLACKHFVKYWWKEGLEKGVRRHKLRLN